MKPIRTAVLILLLSGIASRPSAAVEHVSLKRDGKPIHLSGKLLVEAQNGQLLLLTTEGTLWLVQPEEIVRRKSDAVPFKPLDQKEVAKRLQQEMGDDFKIHTTAHYVICYNTRKEYAEWCGALYERLYKGFTNYWQQQGLKLQEPGMPLTALIFADKSSYMEYARHELGDAAGSIVAYYSLRSNRVIMYDLTGVADSDRPRGSTTSRSTRPLRVNQILSQPRSALMVSTIVHEATHQIAFNNGLMTRYADIPLWVSEGIAVYFESPDLKSSRGWRGIGKLHRRRLLRFNQYLRQRSPDSLTSLLRDDTRFRNIQSIPDAYAEAWALNYYLLKTRKKEYVQYLQRLSAKKPGERDTPQQRLEEFQAVFGMDLRKLDSEFVRYMRRLGR